MRALNKLIGRTKKAAGDLAGDPALRREGALEERKGEVEEDLAHHQREVERKAGEIRDLERDQAELR
jgi:uncharacterized protein YjbJ (UPF0337 family)